MLCLHCFRHKTASAKSNGKHEHTPQNRGIGRPVRQRTPSYCSEPQQHENYRVRMHEHGHNHARTCGGWDHATPHQRQERIVVPNISAYPKIGVVNGTYQLRTVWLSLAPDGSEVFAESRRATHGTPKPLSYRSWRQGGVDMESIEWHRILRTVSSWKQTRTTN